MKIEYTRCDLCSAQEATEGWNWVRLDGSRMSPVVIDICPSCTAALGREQKALRELVRSAVVAGLRADIRHGIGPEEETVQ